MRVRPTLLFALVAASGTAAHLFLEPAEARGALAPVPPPSALASAAVSVEAAHASADAAPERRVALLEGEPRAADSERCPPSSAADEPPREPDRAWMFSIDASILLGDPAAVDADFARWYRSADTQHLARACFRAQHLYEANAQLGLRTWPGFDAQAERDALTHEWTWLTRRLSELRESESTFAPAGLRGDESEDDLQRRFGDASEEDLARLACALDHAACQEVKRLSAERIAAGRYKARALVEPVVMH